MRRIWTQVALTSVLAGGLLLALGTPVSADSRGDCRQKLEADRARTDRDAARHGEHSRQVDRDVQRMDTDRRWCSDHKADWDHDRFDVGIYIRK